MSAHRYEAATGEGPKPVPEIAFLRCPSASDLVIAGVPGFQRRSKLIRSIFVPSHLPKAMDQISVNRNP
jgi:hypothetical protein